MDPFKMVVFIVLIVSLAGVLKAYLDRGTKGSDFASALGLDDMMGDDLTGVGKHLRRIDELEKRIQVLERIVTTNKYDLKQKIDDLARS